VTDEAHNSKAGEPGYHVPVLYQEAIGALNIQPAVFTSIARLVAGVTAMGFLKN
jgi:hypothetical protein